MSNANSTALEVGWMSSSSDRGSLDILWSCAVTISLCVWVSTHPNVPSRKDKWYHGIIDRCNLACIGFLGPDYLMCLAMAQWMNARRSVSAFRDSPELRQGRDWSLTHAFFTDMGGFHLASPDYPDGFPIDTEQLYYLVKHGHVDFPSMTKDEIEDRNKSDGLTKIITLCQVCFFLINEFWRIGHGYPITTLELTTITFSFVMVWTSIAWYHKPDITSPVTIHTRGDRTIEYIRTTARESTHLDLQVDWYRTPLAFLSSHCYTHVNKHWVYYSNISFWLRLPLFGREVKATPWDRVPGDIWYPVTWSWPDRWLIFWGLLIQIPFCLSFLIPWAFYFPTEAEKNIWRGCAVYHALYSLSTTWYFLYTYYLEYKGVNSLWRLILGVKEKDSEAFPGKPPQKELERAERLKLDPSEHPAGWLQKLKQTIMTRADDLRNISPDGDPGMAIPLRWTVMWFPPTFLYILCRVFFYIEDVISLRSQPQGVYLSVERVLPFL